MKRMSDQQKIDIVNLSLTGKYTLKMLSDKFLVTQQAISQLLKRRNISNSIRDNNGRFQKKDYLNESYFDSIDNEHKAYWLGLLYADGYNSVDRGIVEIGLQEDDKFLLEQFKNDIESSSKLLFKNRKKKNKNHKNVYRLFLRSKKLSESLVKAGCPQRKTFILKFPSKEQVPNHLLKHFLRGYWDGDGYIGINKRDTYITISASLVGIENFCLGVQDFIKKELNIDIKMCDSYNKKNKQMYISSRKNVRLVLDLLYKEATIYMKRKYDKYITIVDITKNLI